MPKGTGLVEAAMAAGIEIPVFCYEPRLGDPVGACRMCLCEVAPGPPKPQAACTLTAAEGMVVRTALTSEMARDAQNGTLEFILVNHPLDCPVCDKGGECPLQDLTFRYGPGNTRMTFPKRTFEKPIPISPLIALDRERCILCYRCTRFSEEVAEDGQLVAVNRGAQSVIATFEDEPYRGAFSGNVTELCPVGALTSTQYRFEARPWEIQNVPTVCGLCPVGCNISATTREGKVKRVLSRNHPEVDEGWLCDKGRFAYAHLHARDRITAPLVKAGPRRFEQVSWEDALDAAESTLRAGGASTVTALSGGESVEEAYALAKLLRQGLGANEAVLPEEVPDGFDAYRAPLSALRDAKSIAVALRRAGDRARAGRRPLAALGPPQGRDDHLRRPGRRRRRARHRPRRPALRRDERLLPAAHAERARRRRRVERRRRRRARRREAAPARHLRRRGRDGSRRCVRMAADAEFVLGIGMFESSFRGIADLVLPGTSYLERDGTTVNLEGRLQRQRRAVIAPVPGRDDVDLEARRAVRASRSRRTCRCSSTRSPAKCFGGISFSDVGERAELPPGDGRRGVRHKPGV